MRPTLYADEHGRIVRPDGFLEPRAEKYLARILPVPCSHHDEEGHPTRGHVHERPGYLYPPMPGWWDADVPKRLRQSKLANRQRRWQTHCWKTWRAMGILEKENYNVDK